MNISIKEASTLSPSQKAWNKNKTTCEMPVPARNSSKNEDEDNQDTTSEEDDGEVRAHINT